MSFSEILIEDSYDLFSFLNLNRDINPKHVKYLRTLIDKNGFTGTILVIITDLFEGVEKMYVVDGQHRFKACVDLGIPIRYEIPPREFNTKGEIVSYIAGLNTSSKPWYLQEYMNAWADLGRAPYLIISEKAVQSGLTPSTLIPLYELRIDDTRQSKKFKSGKFEIPNISESERLIKTFQDCSTYINFHHWTQERELSRWIITNRPDYDRLLNICKDNDLPPESLQDELNRIYN